MAVRTINPEKGDKMENNKYNKRRRSYTEFRSSYSDNKKYFISTDKTAKWQPIVKYIIIALIFVVMVVASFLITDALLEISEQPFVREESTSAQEKTDIDDKYFKDQVTVSADEIN